MRFTHPLSDLLGTVGKVDVLRALSETEEPLSVRQVAIRGGLSPAGALAALGELHEAGVLGMVRRGRAHCYWLDRDHALVRTVVLPAFEAERGLRQRALQECLTNVHGYRTAMLYGSVARGEERWRSDIDLLFVVDDEAARASLERQLDEAGFRVLHEFGNDVSSVVLTVEEYRRALDQGQPFLRGVIEEGTLLAGALPLAAEVA